MGGYTGKILRIKLTEGKVSIEPLNMELARKYLSGRGLAGKMFADEVPSEVDALSPENKLFVATGVLTGTNAPTYGRFMVVTKSPLNGGITSSNFGGNWGAQFKFAGYDMVILEGRAKYPVYITIRDDLVEIKDAAHVWGKDVCTATETLRHEFGDNQVKILTIGPAGENLSLMAVVMNDLHRAAGCGGVGAVMGSKNVKAIMVRGSGRVEIANSTEMERVMNVSCEHCPIACGRSAKEDERKSTDHGYKCVGEFGSNLGIYDQDAIQKASDLCNKLGLDIISVNAAIATGIELARLGYIKAEELDGTPLKFGNTQGALEWIRKIAYTEGLGAKMALGSKQLAESYGVREQWQGRNFFTRDRSSRRYKGDMISTERLGFSEKFDCTSLEGKAIWCKTFQDLTAVIDAVGLCFFASFALGLSDYTAMINAATGCKYTDEEILTCGERIWNNERLLNLRVSNSIEEDAFPKWLLNDLIPDDSSKGQGFTLADFLARYYIERGWDEAGVPSLERLTRLGMEM